MNSGGENRFIFSGLSLVCIMYDSLPGLSLIQNTFFMPRGNISLSGKGLMLCVKPATGVVGRQGKSEKSAPATQHYPGFASSKTRDLHGSCLSCSIVTEEGCDLTLIKSNIYPIYCWFGPVCKNLHQVLNAHSWNQSCWLWLKEGIYLKDKKSKMKIESKHLF